MSGTVIKLLDQKRFEFSYLSGGSSQSITVVPTINACDYGFVAIYARLHARDMAAGQSLILSLYNTLPSDEDAREFIETDASGVPLSLLDLTLTSALPFAAPGIFYTATTGSGPYLKLGLKATQTSSPTTFYAEISVLLLMREMR